MDIIECELIPLIEEYWIENPRKVLAYSRDLKEAILYE